MNRGSTGLALAACSRSALRRSTSSCGGRTWRADVGNGSRKGDGSRKGEFSLEGAASLKRAPPAGEPAVPVQIRVPGLSRHCPRRPPLPPCGRHGCPAGLLDEPAAGAPAWAGSGPAGPAPWAARAADAGFIHSNAGTSESSAGSRAGWPPDPAADQGVRTGSENCLSLQLHFRRRPRPVVTGNAGARQRFVSPQEPTVRHSGTTMCHPATGRNNQLAVLNQAASSV